MMADKQQYLMALDFGTGAGRCFIVSLDGKTSFDQYQEWAYDYPEEAQPGGAQFNPQAFWDILASLIRKSIKKSGIDPAQIVGISSTSHREGVVFLDEDGRELYAGPNIDMRAPSNVEEIEAKYGERIHKTCGHWPFPMFVPYRLLWFKEKRPDIYEKIASVLLLNNWMLYRLCGQKGTEPSNGIETLLVDLKTRDWDVDLIRELGFDPSIFPPVSESGTVIGEVTEEAAAETGLKAGTPVVLGGGDTQCALLGTAAVEPGDVGVVLGTFGPIQMAVPMPIISDPELIWSGCHTVPGSWVIESTSMETGQTYRWVRDIFYASESLDTYGVMNREAVASPAGANGVKAYIGPRLPNYRRLEFVGPGGFVTQLPPAPGVVKRGDFARAALESVAFGVRLNIERLQRVSGMDVSVLRVSGGLSKSGLLMQMMANLIGVEVTVPLHKEGSSLGAAICAGVGAGKFSSMQEGVNKLVVMDKTYRPEEGQTYEKLYQDWMSDYQKMYGERTLKE